MKYSAIGLLILLSGCSRQPSNQHIDVHRLQNAEIKTAQVGSPAPSAPIELDYQMPNTAPAGQPLTIALSLRTPIDTGMMVVTVTKQIGVTLLGDTVQSIDLANASRPLQLPLHLLPSAEAQRSVVIVISIDVGGEQQSRSFRVTLPAD